MYTYKLNITSIYDGDTVSGTVDLGFNLKMDIRIRLYGINTPEVRHRDKQHKKRGLAARDFLREFCEKYKDSIMIRTNRKGKYGRWLGELLLSIDDVGWDEELYKYEGCMKESYYCINDILVQEGHAEYKEY